MTGNRGEAKQLCVVCLLSTAVTYGACLWGGTFLLFLSVSLPHSHSLSHTHFPPFLLFPPTDLRRIQSDLSPVLSCPVLSLHLIRSIPSLMSSGGISSPSAPPMSLSSFSPSPTLKRVLPPTAVEQDPPYIDVRSLFPSLSPLSSPNPI